MKILKPGKVEMRKFVCSDCGCEFVVGEGEETVYWDEDDCVAICPMCRERLLWCDGELCEEPTQEQTDSERLARILFAMAAMDDCNSMADYLIQHGVTFREV